MELWAGMVDVAGGPAAEGGAYAYCAGEADDLTGFLARLTATARERGLELRAIDWMARHATLPEPMRLSDPIADVVQAALDAGGVAFDHFHTYPDENDPEAARLDATKEQLETFVGDWLDGAVDAYDEPFTLDGYAFVADLSFAEGSTIALAAASRDPADLLRRAAAAADPGSG
jgi:hypothetical protein